MAGKQIAVIFMGLARGRSRETAQPSGLPKEVQFKGQEVIIREEGNEVILSPRPSDWSRYVADASVASADFMEEVEDLPVQERVP